MVSENIRNANRNKLKLKCENFKLQNMKVVFFNLCFSLDGISVSLNLFKICSCQISAFIFLLLSQEHRYQKLLIIIKGNFQASFRIFVNYQLRVTDIRQWSYFENANHAKHMYIREICSKNLDVDINEQV